MTGLENKSAIIFAGSRGIGRATAIGLGKQSAKVAVGFAGNEEAAKETVTAVKEAGGQAFSFRADVSDGDAVRSAFEQTGQEFGGVDIAINAAAVSVFGPMSGLSKDDLEKSIAVNVIGAFHVLQEAGSRVADHGRIIQFSTGGTKMPMIGGSIYTGTKAAGEIMALGLSKELGDRSITVNVISPGVTDTDGLVMDEEQVDQLVAQTPLGRLGQPDDVADAVVFLCSREGRWLNGQNIQVNGGIL